MNTTPSEEQVRKDFEARGYKTLKNGYPDFIFYKEGDGKIYDVNFVEVKSGTQQLSLNQKICAKILKSLNLNYIKIGGYKRKTSDLKEYYRLKKEKKKKEILDFLGNKKIEIETTTRLTGILNLNYISTLKSLQELEKEGKVETVKIGTSTGWKIK